VPANQRQLYFVLIACPALGNREGIYSCRTDRTCPKVEVTTNPVKILEGVTVTSGKEMMVRVQGGQ
jgi:hypothetical protein